jgi:hypothetical protein
MKIQINEIKRMQQLAGIIVENEQSSVKDQIDAILSTDINSELDIFIKQCNEYANLDSTSPEIDLIVSNQVQANISQNQNTYKGFVIEIEEVPYVPNVTRKRAVGKNQQGIVLIQTELSFTTNNQTLINELKLIIDRDNLKGY